MLNHSHEATQLTIDPVAEKLQPARLSQPVGLVLRLAEELDTHSIRHCNWKGTFSMASVLAGEKDIDLLVDTNDVTALRRVLAELGFKPALAPADRRIEGETHYFGYDDVSGRIVHLHLHEQIVLGHPLTCTYRLPVEEACLASADRQFPFPEPQVEFEFVLFMLRMMLEHTEPRWRRRTTCLTPRRASEFEYLRSRACRSEVDAVLQSHFPVLDPLLIQEACDALADNDRRRFYKLSRNLRRRLDHSGMRRSGNLLRATWRRALRTLRARLLRRPPRKRNMADGGVMVALVGGDGAGKSTVIEHLRLWLGQHFDVEAVHLGKPRRSVTSWMVRGVLKLVRTVATRFSNRSRREQQSPNPPQLCKALWQFCVARDRYHAARKIRRQAGAGRILICDRWPLPDVISMDGPQILQRGGTPLNPLIESLGRLENRWLRSIGTPDVLIVLKLDPEISVRRKPEEDPDFVRSRGLEVWTTNWSDTGARVINAAEPLESVLPQVKALVWNAL